MGRLDRYILTSSGRVLLLALSAFSGLYLLIEFFERVDDFTEHGAAASHYFAYFCGKIPLIMVEVAPLSLLLAVFLGLGSLARHNELTAMLASGVSYLRITLPLILVGVMTTVALLAWDNWVVPGMTRLSDKTFHVDVKGNPPWSVQQADIWLREGTGLLHIGKAFPDENRLDSLSILNLSEDGIPQQRVDIDHASFRDGTWQGENLRYFSFDENSSDIKLRVEPSGVVQIAVKPEDFTKGDPGRHQASLGELFRLYRTLQNSGLPSTRVAVDLHARVAHGITCLVMVLLGLPFAMQRQRGGNLALGIGLSIGLGIVFYLCNSAMIAFGYGGVLPPWVAAWATNGAFILLGVYLLISVRE
ncbi:MAG: LPS export ABC transporter permease LptG [Desulfuromonas sp.]|nr:MAG: LPS export ABC transporter permease LptG [Desulfuromonas sp.]